MKKIAVLGAGSIGQRHIKSLETIGCGFRTYDPSSGAHPGYRNQIIDWADAVVIASPTSNHWEDINDCRRAEKPCFVEKPIGHMPAEMITSHVKMVGYNLRFHSCVKKAREWLGKGWIGQPRWANFTCAQFNDNPVYLRDGVILNWSHEIDLAIHLLGPAIVRSCEATDWHRSGTSNSDINVARTREDTADIVLRHQHNCLTTVHLDYVTKPEVRGFIIGSERGVIKVDLVKRQALLHNNDNVTEVYNGQDSFDENYLDEMRAFLMRLDGQPTIGCTAKEGLDALDICLKAKEMAR